MKNSIFAEGMTFQEGDEHESVGNVRTFLGSLGYTALSPQAAEAASLAFDTDLAEAVKKFQRFHGLEATGVIDQETRETMEMPRCGVPDLTGGQEVHAQGVARFVTSGGKWPSNNLTYRFVNGTSDLAGEAERDIVRQAFDIWAEVTPLRFTEVSGSASADFLISWVTGDHGDGSPFDGPGHVLAHAFFPPPVNPHPGIAGDLHFDDAEMWKAVGETGGIDLLTVAIHELGHALGLRHSMDRDAIMFPTYRGPRHTLGDDDVEGIQSIYGPPESEVTPPSSWWERFWNWFRGLFG